MDPITLSLLMAGGQALMPAIKSMKQGQTLKDLPDVTRPDFQIPEAEKEKLGIARSIVGNRNMPGYNEALDKIENQTNRAIGDVKAAGGNMQDVMAAMAAANMQAGMQKRDLDIANDKSYLGSLQNLQGQLGQYANWQNAQQQDKMKAYNDEMARRAALDTARQQNMQNAIGSVAQGAATGIGYQMNMDLMNKMYPGTTTTTPPVPPVQEPPMEKMAGMEPGKLSMPNAGIGIAPQLNQASISSVNPLDTKVMSESPFNGVEFIPTTPPNTTLNPIVPTGTTGPVMTSPNPMEGNEFSATPTAQQQQAISTLISAGVIPSTKNTPPVNTNNIINALSTFGVIPGGNNYNEQEVMNRILNMPEMTMGQNVTPNFQPTVSAGQQQSQIPFNMLTPQEQQKRILELMTISGVNK
jgi:hypothetical protein